MYHIKDDKRARKSAELVVQAMKDCLAVHGFEDLTITELCNVSTISRATFYRLFDNIEDVVAYQCELFAVSFSEELKGQTIDQLQLSFFKKWIENIGLLKLIVSLRRTDIIYDCHQRHWEELQENLFFHDLKMTLSDYHMAMLTYILVGALIVWCEHGCKESPEELVSSLRTAVKDISVLFI